MVKLEDNHQKRFLRSYLFSKEFIYNHLVDLEEFHVLDVHFLKEKLKEIRSLYHEGIKDLNEAQLEIVSELRKQVYLSLELIATGIFRVYKSGVKDWDVFFRYHELKNYMDANDLEEVDITNPEIEHIVLHIIYSESLVYLFRVLFLLYADHRKLFKHAKVETVFYNLLNKIENYTTEIGSITEKDEAIAHRNDDYDINGVFEEIDMEFNGGLFNQKLHPILKLFDIDEDETYIPLLSDKKKKRPLLKDDLYLVNNKGDRKATGSYYTPDYIVEYIVKNSVGPLVDEIEKEEISPQQKINKIFGLRICDPAMGSGHFLVEVINYLHNRISDLIQNVLEPLLKKPGRKSKQVIDYEELLSKCESGFYKQIIGKRCIYGVDKNKMAVELAKLSIRIFTLQKGRKLESFDYNLRCGDSLIGSQEKTFSARIETESKERMLFANDEELYQNVISDFKDSFQISKIINFEKHFVFQDASITTAIVELNKISKFGDHVLSYVFTEKEYEENEILTKIENDNNFFNEIKIVNGGSTLSQYIRNFIICQSYFVAGEVFKILFAMMIVLTI